MSEKDRRWVGFAAPDVSTGREIFETLALCAFYWFHYSEGDRSVILADPYQPTARPTRFDLNMHFVVKQTVLDDYRDVVTIMLAGAD